MSRLEAWQHPHIGEECGEKRKLKISKGNGIHPGLTKQTGELLRELGECKAQRTTNPKSQFQLEDPTVSTSL